MTLADSIMGCVLSGSRVVMRMKNRPDVVFGAGQVRSSWETEGFLFIVASGMMRVYRKADIQSVER